MNASVDIRPATGCKHESAVQQQPKPGCACQNLLPKRKTHALVGFILMLFLLLHLSIGVTAWSPALYSKVVMRIEAHTILIRASSLVLAVLFAWQGVTGAWLLWKHGFRYDLRSATGEAKAAFSCSACRHC